MASSPQHEPTMEEILASIRKIISEDSPEQQAAAPAAEPASAPAAEPEEADVLDLTQEVQEEPVLEPEPVPEPVAETAPAADDEIVFEEVASAEPEAPAPEPELEPEPEVMIEAEPEFAPEPEPAPEPETAVAVGGEIFSDKTRKALDDAFANIDQAIPEEAPKAVVPPSPLPSVDAHTIEAVFERAVRETVDPVMNKWLGDNTEVVIDRMKPLIREWLDEHFPAILEGAVRDEVARVVKARGGKR